MRTSAPLSTLWLTVALALGASTAGLGGCEKKPDAAEAADDDEPKKKSKKKSSGDDDDDEPKKKSKKKKKGSGDDGGAKGASSGEATAAVEATAAPSAEPAPPAEASFFAGAIPAGVKQKPIKASSLEGGTLLFQPLEGYSGGSLPGYNYMSMRPDSSVVFRVVTSHAVVPRDQGMDCGDIGGHVRMAPERAQNVKQERKGVLRNVGVNGFVAREGSCSGEGAKGPLEIRYIDLRIESGIDDAWHFAAIVSFPKDASQELRDEALAWARSVEFRGRNGYKL